MDSITCPSCNNVVPKGEKSCPHCGDKKHLSLVHCLSCKQQIFKNAKACPHCGSKKHNDFYRKHPIITGFLVLFIVGAIFGDKKESQVSPQQPVKQDVIEGSNANKEVAFSDIVKDVDFDSSWRMNSLGPVMILDGKIKNNSKYKIYDIKITCALYGGSETPIDLVSKVLYQEIPSKSTKNSKS